MAEPIPGPIETAAVLAVVAVLFTIVAVRRGWIRSLLVYVGLWRAK